MKKLYSVSILLILFSFSGTTMAQGLKLGLGGGLSIFSNGSSNFSYTAGYHVGAKIKLDIPLVPITPVAFVNYHFLNGTYDNSSLSVSYTQKILSYGIGVEYSLLPGLVSPYLAIDLGFNNIAAGSGSFNLPAGFSSPVPSLSRTGLDIGAGAEVKIPFLFTLDGSIKYNMMNLLNKDSGEPNLSAVVINISVLF